VLPDEKEDPELALKADPLELAPNDVAPLLVEDNTSLKDDPNLAPESKHPAQSSPFPLIATEDEPILDVKIPELRLPEEPVDGNLDPEESPVLPIELKNPEEDPPVLVPKDVDPPELALNDDDPWFAELLEEIEPDELPDPVEVNPGESPVLPLEPNDDT